MTTASDQNKGGSERSDDLVSITSQFWRGDLAFLDAMADHRLEKSTELRRYAMHVGSLVIAAAGAPDRATGLFGNRWNTHELAQEIADSDVTRAVQLCEREGFTLLTVPTAFVSMFKEAFAGAGNLVRSQPGPEPVVLNRPDPPIAEAKQVTVSSASRKRMNFGSDVSL